MIRPEDILFWGGGNVLARYGTLVRRTSPVAEPPVTFSRASDAWMTGRDGRLRKVASHRPRVEWLDLDGDGARETPALRLEPGRTNALADSSRFAAAGTAWGGANGFTIEAATSIIDGQTAYRHTNLGSATSLNRSQFTGSFTGAADTFWCLIENVDADVSEWGIYDGTAKAFVVRGIFNWSTGAANVTVGSGSVLADKLADVGPNGGALYLLAVIGAGTSGNERWGFIYPTGIAQNTKTVILHHAQMEASIRVPTTPIVTDASARTRAADSLSCEWLHRPQAQTVYLRGVERGNATIASFSFALWGISGGGARVGLWGTTLHPNGYIAEMVNHKNQFATSLCPQSFDLNDRFEFFLRIFADGSIRLDASRNDGTVVMGEHRPPPSGGLAPEWGVPTMWIGARAAGNAGLSALRDVMVLRGADWPADAVRRMVG